jgi:hypothetical protein
MSQTTQKRRIAVRSIIAPNDKEVSQEDRALAILEGRVGADAADPTVLARVASAAGSVSAADLLGRWRDHGIDLTERSVLRPGAGRRTETVRCVHAGRVLEVAVGAEGRRRLRVEIAGRAWARERGIVTPEVLDADPDGAWLLGAWLEPVRPIGAGYVDAAVATARLIARQPEPPEAVVEASSWRASRRDLLVRGMRVVSGGVPPRLWRAARLQVAEVGGERVVAHGDFYPHNVLGTRSGVSVVDWEYVGWAPRSADLVRLWTLLPESADRDRLLAHLSADQPALERRRIGALVLWHALRLLGENLSVARTEQNPVTLRHARAIVPEACEVARDLGAWPR